MKDTFENARNPNQPENVKPRKRPPLMSPDVARFAEELLILDALFDNPAAASKALERYPDFRIGDKS